jgi:selenocysteine lyase/cysteine desulfurase
MMMASDEAAAGIDVARARAQTPACERLIHFNSAGASLMPTPVLEAVVDHLRLEAEIGGYEAAEREEAAWEHTYDSLARLVNAGRDEIAIVENATRAWDMAFYGLSFATGDRILTSVAEYGSNYLAYLQTARRTGARIEVVPNDEAGELSVEALADMLDDDVKLVSITHVPTNGGLVNPAERIGELTRRAGVPFLLDACQSVGQFPVDVEEIGCDVMAVTGRKFLRAPRATGFLYVRRDFIEQIEPPFIDVHAAHWDSPDSYTLRDDARRFENWETNYATKIGLGVAADYALDWGLDEIAAYNFELAASLRSELVAIEGLRVLDLGRRPCSIVTFAIDGCDPRDLRRELAARRIAVTVSMVEDTLLDMTARGYEEWVRASVHYFNTPAEVQAFAGAVNEIVREARR